ncbi:hypothetical protein BH24BAC1_BH24BAC1_33670 [soil metagenome]
MKRFKIFKLPIFVLLFAGTFAGCKKDFEEVSPVEKHVTNDPVASRQTDDHLEFFAKTLAKSLSNVQVRRSIKKEALKQFDGDYDILYSQFQNQILPESGITVEQALGAGAADNGDVTNKVSEIRRAAKEFPKLNIAVPVLIDKWDVENYVPLVAVVLPSHDVEKTGIVKAYDNKGQVFWLDSKLPEMPVVVVGLNERVEINTDGTILIRNFPTISRDGNAGVKTEDITSGIGDGGNKTESVLNTCVPRVEGYREVLSGFWFGDLNTYEHWTLGAPEIVAVVKSGVLNFNGGFDESSIYNAVFEPSKRSYLTEQKWWNFSAPLFTWSTNELGDRLAYSFYEWDGGSKTQDFNVSLKYKFMGVDYTVSTTFKFGNDDDKIGLITVGFTDCGFLYDDGQRAYGYGGGKYEFRFKLTNQSL